MGIYEPTRISIPTGLDEIGLHLGFVRIDGESLYNFQRRCVLETRERSGPTEREFIASVSRQVGEFDIAVFELALKVDGDGNPLASDPWVEVTSSKLRTYSDKANETIDLEIDLYDRDDGYFLSDVYTTLGTSSYFGVTILDNDYANKQSKYLRYSDSDRYIDSEILLASTQNKLSNSNVRAIYPNARTVFVNEKLSLGAVTESGDFYVDYTNGVIFTYESQSGFISYSYRDFPFKLYWQVVKGYPYLDSDKERFHKDTLISDNTGLVEYTLLNDKGAWIANRVLAVHPLTWGQ